jgi:hypothetical protein
MTLGIERIPTLGDHDMDLVVCTESGEAAVIDAPEAGPVFAVVEREGCPVTKTLSTHHRPDHSAAKAADDWHEASPDEITIPSTIGEERITNPFMRARESEEPGCIRLAKDSF